MQAKGYLSHYYVGIDHCPVTLNFQIDIIANFMYWSVYYENFMIDMSVRNQNTWKMMEAGKILNAEDIPGHSKGYTWYYKSKDIVIW